MSTSARFQWRAVGADHVDHPLLEGKATLDHGGEVRGLDLGHGQGAVLASQGAEVGAAPDSRRRSEYADVSVLGERGGDLRLGVDHGDDLDARLGRDLPGDLLARRGGRVAGDHQQLRAAVEEEAAHLLDMRSQLLDGPGAVGKSRIVTEIQVILLGQRDEAFVKHREAADA